MNEGWIELPYLEGGLDVHSSCIVEQKQPCCSIDCFRWINPRRNHRPTSLCKAFHNWMINLQHSTRKFRKWSQFQQPLLIFNKYKLGKQRNCYQYSGRICFTIQYRNLASIDCFVDFRSLRRSASKANMLLFVRLIWWAILTLIKDANLVSSAQK